MPYDFTKLVLNNNKIVKCNNGLLVKMLQEESSLPANTIRVKFAKTSWNFDNWKNTAKCYDELVEYDAYRSTYNKELPISVTVVEETDTYRICDILAEGEGWTKANTEGTGSFLSGTPVLEILDCGDLSHIIDMSGLFQGIPSLFNVEKLDTKNVKYFFGTFQGCGLTKIPQLDLSNAINVTYLFSQNFNANGGALELYNKIKDISTITNHDSTFYCGQSTTIGLNEWQQIPSSWGGGAVG